MTTPSSSEWGSRSLDSLTQQASDVSSIQATGPHSQRSVAVSNAGAGSDATADPGFASGTMRHQGSSNARRSSKEATAGTPQAQDQAQAQSQSQAYPTNKVSHVPHKAGGQQPSGQGAPSGISRDAGRASLHQGQPQQPAAMAASVAASSADRQGSSGEPSGPQGTGWAAEEADWSAFSSSTVSQEPSHRVLPSSAEAAGSRAVAGRADDHWSAFGNGGTPAFQAPDPAFAGSSSQTGQAPDQVVQDGSNPFLDTSVGLSAQTPEQLEMHVSNPFLDPASMSQPGQATGQLEMHGSSPFLEPASASQLGQAPDQLETSGSNPFLAPAGASQAPEGPRQLEGHGSNPFLLPGEEEWPSDTQAAQEPLPDASGIARTASGESFGEFNAPEEDNFEGSAWGGASTSAAEAADWATVNPSSADPFAASASFTDFAALLDGSDALMSTDATMIQPPVAGHVDLSELQHDFSSNGGDVSWQASSLLQDLSQMQGMMALHWLMLGLHSVFECSFASFPSIGTGLNKRVYFAKQVDNERHRLHSMLCAMIPGSIAFM